MKSLPNSFFIILLKIKKLFIFKKFNFQKKQLFLRMIGISGMSQILAEERSVLTIKKQENPERPKINWNYGPPL